MKSNVALIGFMGTGKTAVGKLLAEKLGKGFVELDSLIEQKAGKSVSDIFQQDGEIAFRELEIEAAKDVVRDENLVIACGGGIVLNKINIDRLRRNSIIVCLTASTEVILMRVSDDEERPLLNAPDKSTKIQELLAFREPFYDRAADIKIDTSELDIESIAEDIIGKLKENESLNQ